MIQKQVVIHLKNGLEVTPAAKLVQLANGFESHIYITFEEKKMNAKSIMGMMSLGLNNGEVLTLLADGSDEVEAVAKLEGFLNGNA